MKDELIGLGHGSGGRKTARLIKELFLKHLGNPILDRMEDAAELPVERGRIALTTDSHVVEPLFFPGGDIGKLAVCGTANDLAVKGAKPRFMTAGFVLRSGLELDVLERIVTSMAEELNALEMKLIAGDTKVIEKGEKEDCYITTAGFGTLEHKKTFAPERIEPGDAIIVSGELGNHEAAVMLARSNFGLSQGIRSDVASIWPLVDNLINAEIDIKAMRDPTRGGLATTLAELSEASGFAMVINEGTVPFNPETRGVSEMLGLDPYYLASEGRLIAIVKGEDADRTLEVLRSQELGKGAAVIGEVREKPDGLWLRTLLGSERPLLILEGEQLPRIC
jgi:hydrogenase expression/formation protein HypE